MDGNLTMDSITGYLHYYQLLSAKLRLAYAVMQFIQKD